LQRLSGNERRFQTHENHVISKTIINQALTSNAIVVIEDLTGIRARTNQMPRSKTERRRSNSWAFYQLRQFLEYKGLGSKLFCSLRAVESPHHSCTQLGGG
jgi:putative transposase